MKFIKYLQQGGGIQDQVAALVKAAMSGDQQAQQQVQQIMRAAQQGDLKARLLAEMIQQLMQQMQGGEETPAMRNGGRVGKYKNGKPATRIEYIKRPIRYDDDSNQVTQKRFGVYDLGNGFQQRNDTLDVFTPRGDVDYRTIKQYDGFVDEDGTYHVLDSTVKTERSIVKRINDVLKNIKLKDVLPIFRKNIDLLNDDNMEYRLKQGGKAKRKCPCMLKRQGGRLIEVDSCTGERIR